MCGRGDVFDRFVLDPDHDVLPVVAVALIPEASVDRVHLEVICVDDGAPAVIAHVATVCIAVVQVRFGAAVGDAGLGRVQALVRVAVGVHGGDVVAGVLVEVQDRLEPQVDECCAGRERFEEIGRYEGGREQYYCRCQDGQIGDEHVKLALDGASVLTAGCLKCWTSNEDGSSGPSVFSVCRGECSWDSVLSSYLYFSWRPAMVLNRERTERADRYSVGHERDTSQLNVR